MPSRDLQAAVIQNFGDDAYHVKVDTESAGEAEPLGEEGGVQWRWRRRRVSGGPSSLNWVIGALNFR
jgi:hypothetical protein